MEETKTVYLADGRKVVLDDDDDLILSLISGNKTEDTFKVPYPSGGYGGASLQLSSSEKYLVFPTFPAKAKRRSHCLKLEMDGYSLYTIPDICMVRMLIIAL